MNKVCDISCLEGLTARLSALSEQAAGKGALDAVVAGARALAANTEQNLLARVRGSDRRGLSGRPRYAAHRAMYEGIRVKRDKDFSLAVVSIMGDFRLKWFEKGTDERKTKKGASRGMIGSEHFFADARADEGAVFDAIARSLEKTINKALR